MSDELAAAGQAMYAENSNTVYVNNSNVSSFGVTGDLSHCKYAKSSF